MNSICPNCGFDLKEKKPANFTPLTSKLLSVRAPSTQKMIKSILKTVVEYHPIFAKDIYFFLNSIKDTDDKIIRYSIGEYFSKGHYIKKGIPYLKAMILNFNKNKDKLREVEKKIHGTKPPYREPK